MNNSIDKESNLPVSTYRARNKASSIVAGDMLAISPPIRFIINSQIYLLVQKAGDTSTEFSYQECYNGTICSQINKCDNVVSLK